MPDQYLNEREDFIDLLRILEQETGIQIQLIEKDYWIMHVLHGLKKQGFEFELKGGTSLSKGYQIIHRFSEDIDIHIKAPAHLNVNENPKNDKLKAVQSRKDFYDWLAKNIRIDGIIDVKRDTAFDDTDKYRSGGIRLFYESKVGNLEGVKDGILLEAGFDTVKPNKKRLISSWAFEKASGNTKISIIDNRAVDVACYHPGYTFVEKLQTVATKYRQEQETGEKKVNLMRQYYDLYCLLQVPEVLEFIGTEGYIEHKKARFPKKDFDIPVSENEAFLLSNPKQRTEFELRYKGTEALYYKGQPAFGLLLERLKSVVVDL
ncbi:MAG: nucleotidyl transferase AbiEii/AbiGii toxin family protein [Algoriphagus sp.]|nr:nucleotidyl transferase AbiEii/AbiGii toxin family protein [Algoriphagus sp.]